MSAARVPADRRRVEELSPADIYRRGPAGQGGEHGHNWKGDAAGVFAKRTRARKVIPSLGRCEMCGAKATDRHHVDGDVGNNSRANLVALCRRCHMMIDGRLERFLETRRNQAPHPAKPCTECGRPYKPLRKGLCGACDRRRRRPARGAGNIGRPPNSNNTTGYKGVVWVKRFGRFEARLEHNGKVHYLGGYNTAVEAALAYNAGALRIFGPAAYMNPVTIPEGAER